MKPNYAHITLILDRSGSMSSIRNDVVGGLNEFIRKQQETPGECTFTLVQFDDEDPFEKLHDFTKMADVKPVGGEYFPRGNTPLYDAVGKGIVSLGEHLAKMPESDRPSKVIFAIMTDGEENASREYTKDRIAAMTKEQAEKYGWQFIYLGANQDAMQVGKSIGTAAASTANYTTQNTRAAIVETSSNVAKFRTGAAVSTAYSDEQRAKLTAP